MKDHSDIIEYQCFTLEPSTKKQKINDDHANVPIHILKGTPDDIDVGFLMEETSHFEDQ